MSLADTLEIHAGWIETSQHPPRCLCGTELSPENTTRAWAEHVEAALYAETALYGDIGLLLVVATLYVDAFSDDEMMSLTEKLRLQEVEAILERHGRRY